MRKESRVFFLLVMVIGLLFLFGCASEQPLAGEAVEVPPTEQVVSQPLPSATLPVDRPPASPAPGPALLPEVLIEERTATLDISTIKPLLTYSNAYNGPLYDTASQMGDSAPLEKYTVALKRNGVAVVLGFFSVEPNFLTGLPADEEWEYLQTALKRYPGQFVPFLSTGLPAEEVKQYLGDVLVEGSRKTLDISHQKLGPGVIKGLGEIEQYAWPIDADDQKMMSLVELAKKEGIAFMFHPPRGDADAVRTLIERYPTVTFLMHMFPEDFSSDRSGYIDLLKTHDNFYYGIDADHTMFDGQSGLLYKYEDEPVERARDRFVTDFDQNYQRLLSQAVARYKVLVEEVPDKVVWGTELGTDYGYEPEVYDRMIKYSRQFIAQMPAEHQEALAYKNAVRVFGTGVEMEQS